MPSTPSPPPPKLREICLLCLFAQQSCPDQDPHFCQILADELKVSLSWAQAGWQRANSFAPHLPDIDKLIETNVKGYNSSRLGAVERTALRLGICELLFDTTIPFKVATSEAMRLVSKFSNRKSAAFVNAVMDSIASQRVDESEIK